MLDFTKLIITDEEIAFVENQFGFSFNEGQKKVIRFWNKADIQACPGSGKTTTLAAKLIILANRIPKSFAQGICVITHTNVAVEEIKSKLGSYSNFFFSYPNHFGTIQSVVDKYLTIPAFKNEFKNSPTIIDTDSLCKEINKFNVLKGTAMLLSAKGIDEIGYLSFNKFNFMVSRSISDPEPFALEGIASDKMARHYGLISRAKISLYQQGFVKYDEAYSVAFKYLRENPSLRALFCKRFPLVFIDEMQDMESHQSELISLMFGNNVSIVQKIGDINQSIFNYHTTDNQNEWKPNREEELQLTITTRLSDNIAQTVKGVCVEPQEMKGWTNNNPIKPTIIVFDDKTISNVKDAFGALIIQNNLEGKTCKAIGARLGASKLNINSYWSEFNRGFKKSDFSTLNAYIRNTQSFFVQTKSVKDARRNLLSILCKGLRLNMVKNPITSFYFTPYTLTQYFYALEDSSNFTEIGKNLTRWIVSLSDTATLKKELQESINKLITHFNVKPSNELNEFLTNTEEDPSYEKAENKIYSFSEGDKRVDIHFDTIHGVKGETHQATLYLETFNRIYDIGGKVLEFISSDETKRAKLRAKDNALRKRLPLAYVAKTRATHFVCLAVHKDRFGEDLRAYFSQSDEWAILDLQQN